MRTSLIIVLVLCVASVSLARRHHKKHHRRNWHRADDQVPQPSYYEPDVYYDPPISSDDNQNTNDGWEYSDDSTGVKVDDRWSNVEQENPVDEGWSNPAVDPVDEGWSNPAVDPVDEGWSNPAVNPVDEGWSNPSVDPVDPGYENPEIVDPGYENPEIVDPGYENPEIVDPGYENPEIVDPAPVDSSFENEEMVDPGFENPEVVDPVPMDEAWGKDEVDQNAWVEEREQKEVVEPEDPSEVDWQEALQERKPWFDEQVEIRHEKVPSPSLEEYDDGFEEETMEAIDGIDMMDLKESPDLYESQDTSEELYGDESESAGYSSETSEENMDTSEELYGGDSESQAYSSETSEEYDNVYGKRDGHDDWNTEEDGNDAREDEEEADFWWTSTTPAYIAEPEAFEELGQKWRAFTAWHYAVFAVAGAIFLIGFMIIVVTAIRACRYRKPSYRRLETKSVPIDV